MAEMISFLRPDGAGAAGYLAEPASGPSGPAVVVIHEWWGLQDQIKSICDEYARNGYRALAPDLYGGTVAKDAATAGTLMNQLDMLDATDQVVRGAVQHLKATSPKVGLSGYCMGGVVTLLGAIRLKEVDASVCYYGIPPEALWDIAGVNAPLLGHFATRDPFFAIDTARDLLVKLASAGKSVEFHEYDADHAFCNDRRLEVFDPAACALATERTMAFWGKHL